MSEFSVTPLGTVSPYPKGKCNCPGFLVQSGDNKVLLDCGSGVSRLLKFPEDLKNLIIIISHLHNDHYSDLGSFAIAAFCYHRLGELNENEKIKVYHPAYELLMSKILALIGWSGSSYLEFIDYTEKGAHIPINNFYSYFDVKYGDMNLSFFKNIHGSSYNEHKTYSTKIESNGKTLVYTADTEYNDNFIEFCKNADLLISEATFLKGQKCTPGHMYAYQAGMLAKNANVKKLMLTHFWPEIDKQLYVEEAQEYFANTIAAEEGKKLILRRK